MTVRHVDILERSSIGKHPGQTRNEDGLVVTANHVFVFDGLTDRSGSSFDGISGGRFATRAAAAAVPALQPDATLADTIEQLTAAVADALTSAAAGGAVDIRPGGYGGRPCTFFTAYSRTRRELWRLGDGHLAAGSFLSRGSKLVDDIAYAFRAAVNEAHLAAGVSIEQLLAADAGSDAAYALGAHQSGFANRPGPYGYGVIDGTTVPAQFFESWPLPDDATEVVLTSDGYLTPAATLAAAEAELADAMRADPLGLTALRPMGKGLRAGNNGPDDRTYVRFRV